MLVLYLLSFHSSPSAVDGKHCLPQTCEHKLHCEEFSADGESGGTISAYIIILHNRDF